MKTHVQLLNEVMDEIFTEAYNLDYSSRHLANESGLCYQTIRNLENLKTKRPQLRTVFLLGQAVGMNITITKLQRGRKVG